MLRGIPENISPELLKALADMGHGDRIVIADNFYPAVSRAKDGITINCKGNTAAEMVESILKLMPLDVDYCEYPVEIMKPDPGFEHTLPERPKVWDDVIEAVKKNEPKDCVGYIGRSDFYEKASRAFVTVSTSETGTYGCIIMQKGVK